MLIKKSDLECTVNKLVLTKDEALQFRKVENLLHECESLRDKENEAVEIAKTQGYESGYKEGLNDGIDGLSEKFKEHIINMSKNIEQIHTLSDERVLELALNITKKIALDIGPEDMITGIAKSALKKMKSDSNIEIKVNPEMVEVLDNNIKHTIQKSNNNVNIEIIPDKKLGKLDCIISSESGVTEASFSQQLNLLKQKINRAAKISSH
jgi:flagellar biosynthesis/type III secretory pathway protein FliH